MKRLLSEVKEPSKKQQTNAHHTGGKKVRTEGRRAGGGEARSSNKTQLRTPVKPPLPALMTLKQSVFTLNKKI